MRHSPKSQNQSVLNRVNFLYGYDIKFSVSQKKTLALTGTVGGAGTTRVAVECATTLALEGRHVAVLDAAYATQGLAGYADGRIDPDSTKLSTCDHPLADAMMDLNVDVTGRVALCPSYAPFERIAEAKTPEAARRFGARIDEAAGWFDHVVVDTPPVAANQAVAAVNAVDRVAFVTPHTQRGLDALPRAIDRLRDVGVEDHLVVATRTNDPVPDADAIVPDSDVRTPGDAPAVIADSEFVESMVDVVETLFETDLDIDVNDHGLRSYLPV